MFGTRKIGKIRPRVNDALTHVGGSGEIFLYILVNYT